MKAWLKITNKRYVAAASTLSVTNDRDKCPKCDEKFSVKHLVCTSREGNEIIKWIYEHNCGTALVILND